jgi:hypothetical protein
VVATSETPGTTSPSSAGGDAGERVAWISLVDGVLFTDALPSGRAVSPRGRAVVAVRGDVRSVSIDRDVHYTQPPNAQFGIDPAAGWRVPEHHLFLLGDHSSNSLDSRYAPPTGPGPVPLDRVIGRVVFRVWPLGRIGPVR